MNNTHQTIVVGAVAVGIVIIAGAIYYAANTAQLPPADPQEEPQESEQPVPNDGQAGTETVTTRIDQGASALDVNVVPLEVLEDSRCPQDVQCIQAGTVRIRAQLTSGLGQANQIFELEKPITTEAEEVTLIQVTPIPKAGETISLSAYEFVFRITKRN